MLEPSKKHSMHAEHGHHHHAAEQRRARTKRENNERKHRLQSDGRSSVTRSIAHAIVLKDRDLFFLSEERRLGASERRTRARTLLSRLPLFERL